MLGLPRAYWVLVLGGFINRLGGVVFVFLPLYLVQVRGLSVAKAGGVASLYGLGAFASAMAGGWLADHFGRRRTIALGTMLGAAAMTALGLARTIPQIVFAAFVLGFLGDLYRPALNAAVGDLVTPEQRTKAFGYLYWAVNLGFAAGASIGGLLLSAGFSVIFIADAATTLIFGALVFFTVPETRPASAEKPQGGSWVAWQNWKFVGLALAQLPVVLVFLQCEATLALDMRSHGIAPKVYGLLVALNGVFIVIFQPLAVRSVKREREGLFLALGALLVGVGYGVNLLPAFTGPLGIPIYVAGILLWSLGEVFFASIVPSVMTHLAPPDQRGRYMGGYGMMWGAAHCLAPIVGTSVLQAFGSVTLWSSCFVVCALAAMAHLILAKGRETLAV